MEFNKPLFDKNKSYEWTVKTNLVSNLYKSYTTFRKQWSIIIALLIPLDYLLKNLINESKFIESFFIIIIMIVCFYVFIVKPINMLMLKSISQTKYRIGNNGVNINKLNTNENKHYSWDELKCFYYDREDKKNHLMNMVADDYILITVIDNKRYSMFVKVPSKLIDGVDSLLSNHIPFQSVKIMLNKLDYYVLLLLVCGSLFWFIAFNIM